MMNFGKAEGLKKREFGSSLSLYLSGFQRHQNPERYDIGYPGGETTGAVQQRFMKFINKLFEEGRERVRWLRTECSSAFLPKYA